MRRKKKGLHNKGKHSLFFHTEDGADEFLLKHRKSQLLNAAALAPAPSLIKLKVYVRIKGEEWKTSLVSISFNGTVALTRRLFGETERNQ